MLAITELAKNFGNKTVLQNIDFSIHKNEIVGLVGPNGSGKTTLLNILMGTIKPSSGGFELSPQIQVGMAVSRKGFFDDMTTENNLLMYAKLIGTNPSTLRTLMDRFQIDFGKIMFGKLSAGMKQRASLILAFLKNYDLVYLDEPSNHLDIDSIIMLRSLISERKSEGTSFLITSHILSDLEKICDRIIFLQDGAITKNELTKNLIRDFGNLEEAYLSVSTTRAK